MIAAGRELIEPWPTHPDLPGHGAVLRRDVLDELLRDRVRAAGASVLMGHEAIAPVVERGFVRGALLATADGERQIRAALRRRRRRCQQSIRAPSAPPERDWPYGIATRSYWNSPRTNDTWLETRLGIPDANGNPIAGYGWIAPVGDGTVNIGIGLLSSYRDVRGVNALKLLDVVRPAGRRRVADRSLADPLKSPTRFRVPLGRSVGPTMGPTFLVVGDAAGAANPFNGDGVNAALLTGRLAGDVLDEALTTGNSTTLQRYPTLLADAAGQYDKVGRLAARFLGRPAILRPLLRVGMRSDRVMGAALRIATGELRADGAGSAERAYAAAAALSKLAPNW